MPRKSVAKIKEEARQEALEEIKEEQKKRQKIWNSIYEVVDTLAMVLAAAAGIILSKYIPMFKAGQAINFVLPEWARLIMSFVLAFGVVAATELKGDIKGKKKNFVKRLWGCFAGGLTWHTLLGF